MSNQVHHNLTPHWAGGKWNPANLPFLASFSASDNRLLFSLLMFVRDHFVDRKPVRSTVLPLHCHQLGACTQHGIQHLARPILPSLMAFPPPTQLSFTKVEIYFYFSTQICQFSPHSAFITCISPLFIIHIQWLILNIAKICLQKKC